MLLTAHKRSLDEFCRVAAATLNKGNKGKPITCYAETTHLQVQDEVTTIVDVFINGNIVFKESAKGTADNVDSCEDLLCIKLKERIFTEGIKFMLK